MKPNKEESDDEDYAEANNMINRPLQRQQTETADQ